jgi:alkylation response protein AidB-like acyl-CoA dehydrogenase
MDLHLDPEQEALREAAAAALSAVAAGGRSAPDDEHARASAWGVLVDQGWTGLVVPEHLGGLGLRYVDLVVLLEELGRWVLPVPAMSSVGFAVPLLLSLDATPTRDRCLRELAGGAVGSLAMHHGASSVDDPGCGVAWDGRSLQGHKRHVTDASGSSFLLVPVTCGGGRSAVAVVPTATEGVTTVERGGIDPGRPLSDVHFDRVRLPGDAILSGDLELGIHRATVALAADLQGVGQRALDLSVEHARVREQFGRPIGSFQAIKHLLADVHVALELSRSLLHVAALALTSPADSSIDPQAATSMAKASTSAAALRAVRACVQVHGALGITREHEAHLLFRRAKQGRLLMGDELWHYAAVGRRAV